MNRIIGAFDFFDPLSEKLSEDLMVSVGYVYQRSMRIIPKDFKINDLNAGLEAIDQMIKQGGLAAHIWASNKMKADDQKLIAHTISLNLYLTKDQFELEARPNGKTFQWSSIFAIVALANVANYVELDQELPPTASATDQLPNLQEETYTGGQRIKSELPLEAMEAIGYAETFYNSERIKNKQSESRKKTTIQHYHKLKVEIVNQYLVLAGTKSDRQTAIQIHDNLPEHLKYISLSSDPVQQIRTWIYQYKKGTLAGIELLPPYS